MLEQDSQSGVSEENFYNLKDQIEFERQQLEKQQIGIRSECTTRTNKLIYLRNALAIESSADVKFQLESQITSEEQEIKHLNYQLSQIEQRLKLIVSTDSPLDLIGIKPEIIEEINRQLRAINRLQEAQLLAPAQPERLILLKDKLQSLNHKDIQQILTEISATADQFIQDAIKSIKSQLKDIHASQIQSLQKDQLSECLTKGLEILQDFYQELEEGKQVAEWLNERRSRLVKLLGDHALKIHQDIKHSKLDQSKVDDFYFTIEQFLECLSHCLVWGNSRILELSEIPRVFEAEVYETAFIHLRNIVSKYQISNPGIAQLDEYIDVLLLNLPSCPEINF